MNKTFLLINPFPESASHGIHNYNVNLLNYLALKDIKTDYFANNKKLSPEKFRVEVYKYVTENYGIDEVLIEAPEVKASTLLLSKEYRIHIRMHTPGAIAQKYDNAEVNEELFAIELSVINNSKYVSSPSYGLIEELKDKITREDINVYKNPFNLNIEISTEKEYNLIFMGRFQTLKGIEYINDILLRLPAEYQVVLLGNNSSKFLIHPRVKCNVLKLEEISTDERFEYVKKSKVLMQLSNFENCSMVILEAFACGTCVVAWDVGGNKEMANQTVLRIAPKKNIEYIVNEIIDLNEDIHSYPKVDDFLEAIENIQIDFKNGLSNILNENEKIYKGLNLSHKHDLNIDYLKTKSVISHDAEYKKFGSRILAFSLSNEQIEEMWVPIIDKFGADYKFICRRPLGFMYKFNNPFYVDKDKFEQFDWIRYPNLLIQQISEYKPNKILFHNGIHPMYKNILDRVKKAYPNIPIVYSELGWLPQKDHIYFDIEGTNGSSKISKQSFEEFCEEKYPTISNENIEGSHILIVTQLENDTNLLVNSKRFKTMINFVRYVISELPNEKFIIKTHPLDEDKDRFNIFNNETVKVVHEGDLESLIKASKAVIGINSTVLLEALKYDTNVYMFGDYLLSNKKVVIEVGVNESLKELWTDKYYSSRTAKDMVLNEFLNRQIHIPSLKNYTVSELLDKKAFKPLLMGIYDYGNKIEHDILKSRLENNKATKLRNNDFKKKNIAKEDITIETDYEALHNKAKSLYHSGKFEESLAIFKKVDDLKPNRMGVKRSIVEILLLLGRDKEAISLLEEIHKAIPENVKVKKRLNYLKHPLLNVFKKEDKFPIPR